MCKHITGRGIWGYAPPKKFMECWCSCPIVPYGTRFSCPINCLKNGKLVGSPGRLGETCSHCLPSACGMPPAWQLTSYMHVGIVWACTEQCQLVVGDAKQAKSEGESGPVETRLTRLTATALQCCSKVSIGPANKVTCSSWCWSNSLMVLLLFVLLSLNPYIGGGLFTALLWWLSYSGL